MNKCKHEHWLYVPSDSRIGDRNVLSLEENRFLCADCGEWIGMGSIEIDKIVNVEKVDRETCEHIVKFYTLGGTYLCLQCGYSWYPEIKKLEVVSSISAEELERRDRERRQRILDDYYEEKKGVVPRII